MEASVEASVAASRVAMLAVCEEGEFRSRRLPSTRPLTLDVHHQRQDPLLLLLLLQLRWFASPPLQRAPHHGRLHLRHDQLHQRLLQLDRPLWLPLRRRRNHAHPTLRLYRLQLLLQF